MGLSKERSDSEQAGESAAGQLYRPAERSWTEEGQLLSERSERHVERER
jgi:hypothetical protein